MPSMTGDCQDVDILLKDDEKYQGIKYLGSGAFGDVILAKNRKTGEEVAVKFIPRGPQHVTRYVLRELLTHSRFYHPHVVHFREVFLTATHLCVVLEFSPGGDLYTHCCDKGCLPEKEARRLLQQIVVAVDYIHRLGVVNRDIKLENTLLDSTKKFVKICDFGFAKGPEDSLPNSNVGTPSYAAPEVIRKEQYNGRLADVWSAGVTLYVMLFHAYPFERPSDPSGPAGYNLMTSRARIGDYIIPKHPKVSEDCKDFLRRCLQPQPSNRITVEQIFVHPWFVINFPASAKDLNKSCLQRHTLDEKAKKMQEDIKSLVEVARKLPAE